MKKDRDPILLRVFAAYGNESMAAKALGVTRQALNIWVRVPLHHVKKIEADTGIPRAELRKDIYG